MKHTLLQFATLLIGWLITPGATFAQADTPDLVLAAERNRFNLQVAADTAALRQTLHPDLFYIHSNGREESADDLVASVASGEITYQSFEPLQPPRVQTFGNTALVDGLVKVTGLYQSSEFTADLRYTSVYQKAQGQWLLIRWQSLKL